MLYHHLPFDISLYYYICFISIASRTWQLTTKHIFVSCVTSIVSASGSLNAAVKVLAGPSVSVKAGLGKGPLSRSCAGWQRSVSYRLWDRKLQFFLDCWLEAIFGCLSQWMLITMARNMRQLTPRQLLLLRESGVLSPWPLQS